MNTQENILIAEYGRWRVYDDRNGQIVFQSNDKSDCIAYMDNFSEDDEEFNHLWLR